MIYGAIVKQYENTKGHESIDESGIILEFLEKEQYNYRSLLDNNYLSESERDILEAKYEVIQEAVGAAIIAAIIAVVGAIVTILIAIVKVISKGSSNVVSQVKKFKNNYGSSFEDVVKNVYKELDEYFSKENKSDIKRINFVYSDIECICSPTLFKQFSFKVNQFIKADDNMFARAMNGTEILHFVDTIDKPLQKIIGKSIIHKNDSANTEIEVPSIDSLKSLMSIILIIPRYLY